MVAEDERDQKAQGEDLGEVTDEPISAEKPRASVRPVARVACHRVRVPQEALKNNLIVCATVLPAGPSKSHVRAASDHSGSLLRPCHISSVS